MIAEEVEANRMEFVVNGDGFLMGACVQWLGTPDGKQTPVNAGKSCFLHSPYVIS